MTTTPGEPAVHEPSEAEMAWSAMSPAELVDHIEAVHHGYLKAEVPMLVALATSVADAHRPRHPELDDVAECLEEIRADLEIHLLKEERVLFPMIRELARVGTPPQHRRGPVRNPISVMILEHEHADALLDRLRTLTGVYRVPDDGCARYRALYTGLATLDADLQVHVHKENNLLFPAVLALERQFA